MTLPDKFIEVIEMLPPVDRGQAYLAVISYMRNGQEPPADISAASRAVFYALKIDIDRVLSRRRREAALRSRRRAQRMHTAMPKNEKQKAAPQHPESKQQEMPQPPALSRQQRRALERASRRM